MRTTEDSHGTGNAIEATMVRYDDRPEERTLYLTPTGEKRTTEWMCASRGGYVSLGLCR
ncbi:DUF7511 domain-containing protein [Halorubrum cibi]|uniref:DUF7511 domain-containing protein n=1 Tax=Halorubrum cibi TaxID=413815 RepID=A0A521C3S5_9EURY|nr:hypothetical protein [Halorubrum cibi]SMO54127.1 hypothetical protein SAMN06264867_103294 [Halorubrum cibi]